MKIVVFGLTISSSWGNGHATLWRGLSKALARRGHHVVFFEKDVPYYANNRDLFEVPGGCLVLYDDWSSIKSRARTEVRGADVVMVTSYCPDGISATDIVLDAATAIRVFYDLDTPVTLSHLKARETLGYIGQHGLRGFDWVLSYTGGSALDKLRTELGAPRVAPLYGHVDPDVHRPTTPLPHYASDLSYLGTYAADRQEVLQRLFLGAAGSRPFRRFLIGGAQYPQDFPWLPNTFFVHHLPPQEHPAFFSSSRLTLNVTRKAMAELGWCPSGRLFEAAACGVAILSDNWPGLESFFDPGREILIATTTEEALNALDLTDTELKRLAHAGRERVLNDHTSARRVEEFEVILQSSTSPVRINRSTVEMGA